MWELKFRNTNLSLSILLWLLVITVFAIYPITDKGLFSEILFVLFVCFIFLSGIFSLTHKRKERAITISLTFLLFMAGIFILDRNLGETNIIMMALLIAYLTLLSLLLLKKIFTADIYIIVRIQGAVAVYILFALIFSLAYRICFLADPTSIHFTNIQNASGKAAPFEYLYFSFLILTTMGYGTAYPVGHFVQSLAMVEALLGVLFPSVLIARLMSMGSITNKEK